ncbi:MAG: DUF1698 domain-containing protein [Gemmatimonadetes bacterium]|nr:DUF1698 domain-containing protein [Gemmatimonadota bacterium]
MPVRTSPLSRADLEQMAASVPFWFHSIDLGEGVTTPGIKSAAHLRKEVESFRLPDLKGKTVLDINAWDGFYSFEAERRGARRVVALDKMMWAMDLGEWNRYWLECKASGKAPLAFQDTPFWHPDTLPGKIGFDTAHQALGSRVESVVDDFMEMDISTLGQFDVVFFLGSLYHMMNPVEAMLRVSAVTNGTAIIETEAVAFPGFEDRAVCEFFPADELNGDSSNWWAPNEKALVGMCRAAGFREIRVIVGSPSLPGSSIARVRSAARNVLGKLGIRPKLDYADSHVVRYRAVVHASK